MMPAAHAARALECVDLDALPAAETVRTAANPATAVMAKIATCVPAVLPYMYTGLYHAKALAMPPPAPPSILSGLYHAKPMAMPIRESPSRLSRET
mmetsp:Transcript_3469/g.6337  ORF Transcript_3469/g.6337 Transcript_3469/m.6337 type:complete len:96 (-) Transcript_3469:126-413(-)